LISESALTTAFFLVVRFRFGLAAG